MRNWITGFDHPGFFYALAALLVLLAIYWFHRRSTVKRVPAIFLWDRPETSPESGSRRMFRKLPLSFYLEALALTLLALAAASPFRMGMDAYPALAVVLDNSFSMRAESPDGATPRSRGAEALAKLLDAHPGRRVLLVLAGSEPRLLSDGRTKPALDRWTADEAAADLAGALALARSRVPDAEFLLVTDRKPEFPLADDVGVSASGSPLGNAALVNVRRNGGTILAEALNASPSARRVTLKLVPGGSAGEAELAPGERRKFVCRVPDPLLDKTITVELEAAGDPLAFDNSSPLLPEDRSPVGFRFAAELPEPLVRELGAVLDGNPDYRNSSTPELVCGRFDLPPGNYHRLLWNPGNPERVGSAPEPISFRAGSPLTRGLGGEGVRWNADPAVALPGEVLIRRGDAELLSFRRRLDGYCDIYLNLAPERSNVSRTPLWPALFWNIADLVRSERPGPGRRNRRSGEVIALRVPSGVKTLTLHAADGTLRSVTPLRGVALLADLPPGVSRVTAGEMAWEVAVSPLSAAESDLEKAGAFERRPVRVRGMEENPRLPLGWIALLLAAAALMVHQYKLGTKRGGA